MHLLPRMFYLAIGTVMLASCGNGTLADAQRQAVATMSKQLPLPYRDGLMIESVHRHGDDLVQVIRSPDATVDMAKAKPEVFEALRLDEDYAITDLCADATLLPLYNAGGGVRRRFIDANGAVFFEVTLKASHCVSN
ncbi:hypothetical protein [Stenotrophomonas sp. SY1]|uniref:hypothetical protein n=1 Tax=Stenotrophomonas sp. SY1 TaxID=477235 RepID=UPI001E489FE5|nr:hypothetical protein [Stenotrophomonas sp. SY1]MCD9088332.1 hypothetical protein [Stenotrophomonas sp. SY1]